MPLPGQTILDANGRRVLRASGKKAIIGPSGDCPGCCDSWECHQVTYFGTFAMTCCISDKSTLTPSAITLTPKAGLSDPEATIALEIADFLASPPVLQGNIVDRLHWEANSASFTVGGNTYRIEFYTTTGDGLDTTHFNGLVRVQKLVAGVWEYDTSFGRVESPTPDFPNESDATCCKSVQTLTLTSTVLFNSSTGPGWTLTLGNNQCCRTCAGCCKTEFDKCNDGVDQCLELLHPDCLKITGYTTGDLDPSGCTDCTPPTSVTEWDGTFCNVGAGEDICYWGDVPGPGTATAINGTALWEWNIGKRDDGCFILSIKCGKIVGGVLYEAGLVWQGLKCACDGAGPVGVYTRTGGCDMTATLTVEAVP